MKKEENAKQYSCDFYAHDGTRLTLGGLSASHNVCVWLSVDPRDAVRNKGNKVFGAAILKLSDLSLVCVGTNTEVESPLWHGEVSPARS